MLANDSREHGLSERYQGALLGLAVGDALGAALEFKAPGTFTPITDMVGGGPFRLAPGQWTDDTAMSLCLAESLIEQRRFDAEDQMRRYLRWYREGYMSCTGACFDIGSTVSAALRRFELTGNPFAGVTDGRSAGNGSLMRLAPIPLAYAQAPRIAIDLAADMSRTTHAAPEAVDACRFFAGLLVGVLRGESKAAVLSARYSPIPGIWSEMPLAPRIDAIAAGSFKAKQPPEIRGTGYVVDSLEAALWAFSQSSSFEQGALAAVNLGDDADTTGAIYGQIGGAFYGYEAIPLRWREQIARHAWIMEIANALIVLSEDIGAWRKNAEDAACE